MSWLPHTQMSLISRSTLLNISTKSTDCFSRSSLDEPKNFAVYRPHGMDSTNGNVYTFVWKCVQHITTNDVKLWFRLHCVDSFNGFATQCLLLVPIGIFNVQNLIEKAQLSVCCLNECKWPRPLLLFVAYIFWINQINWNICHAWAADTICTLDYSSTCYSR